MLRVERITHDRWSGKAFGFALYGASYAVEGGLERYVTGVCPLKAALEAIRGAIREHALIALDWGVDKAQADGCADSPLLFDV